MAYSALAFLLGEIFVKDIYAKDGETAITVRFTFEAKDRTLSKQELTPITDKIAEKLGEIGMTLKV